MKWRYVTELLLLIIKQRRQQLLYYNMILMTARQRPSQTTCSKRKLGSTCTFPLVWYTSLLFSFSLSLYTHIYILLNNILLFSLSYTCTFSLFSPFFVHFLSLSRYSYMHARTHADNANAEDQNTAFSIAPSKAFACYQLVDRSVYFVRGSCSFHIFILLKN